MSLIEEALRKQQEIATHGAPPAAAKTGTPPPPLPERPTGDGSAAASPPPSRNPAIAPAVAVLGFVAILLAITVWMYHSWLSRQEDHEQVVRRLVTRVRNLADARRAAGKRARESTNAVHAAQSPLPPGAAAAASIASTARVEPPRPTVTTTAPLPVVEVGVALGPVELPATHTAAAPRAVKPAVIWPPFHLSGILDAHGMGRGAAIINGKIVYRGSAIDGATLVEVDRLGVTLQYRGEERTLHMDASGE